MRFNLDTLQALTQSADYCALPTRFAREAVPDDNWWQILEALTDEGARIKVWEIGQCAALLFDTYGDLIEEVSLDVGHYTISNEPYMTLVLNINGQQCLEDRAGLEDGVDLEDETLDAMEAIDGKVVVESVVERLSNLANSNLLGKIGTLEAELSKPYTSGDEARARAAGAAPRIEAWARQQRLTLMARAAQDDGSARKSHKM